MEGGTTLILHVDWIKGNSSISLITDLNFVRILPSLIGYGFMLRSTRGVLISP